MLSFSSKDKDFALTKNSHEKSHDTSNDLNHPNIISFKTTQENSYCFIKCFMKDFMEALPEPLKSHIEPKKTLIEPKKTLVEQ